MCKEQRIMYFVGNVQGVGFRYTACRVARGHDITGYVRNMPDGRVECVVEGQAAEIDAFQTDLAAHMSGYIRGVEQRQSPYTGRFETFGLEF